MRYAAFCLLALSLALVSSYAQPNLDSLVKILPLLKDDTNKVNVLNTLGRGYLESDPQKGISYSKQAIALAEHLDFKTGLTTAYNNAGASYKSMSDFPKALDYLFKSLKNNEALNNRVNMAKNLGNIGNVYRMSGNLQKALEYQNKALVINRQLDRKIGITNNLSDIGIVYVELRNHKKALEYFYQALDISKAADDVEGVAIVYGNLANTYSDMGDAQKAIECFTESLKINRELKREIGVAINLSNLGDLYLNVISDTTGKTYSTLQPQGKEARIDKAISYFNEAIPLYEAMSNPEGINSCYAGLAIAYTAKQDYKHALEAYRKHITIKDSINSTDNSVKLAKIDAHRAEYEKEQQVKLNDLLEMKRRNETIVFIAGMIFLLIFIGFVVKERRKSDKLLLNILPSEVAGELKKTGTSTAKHYDNVTVFFSDFVNFTAITERMSPAELVNELHTCFKAFDNIMSKYKIEKIKTVGDAYLAISGLPVATPLHAANVVNAAIEIMQFVNERKQQRGANAFEIRIGIHSGSVVAGIVGVKKFAYDIWGDTVNTAARIEESSEPGKINISETTYQLVKGNFNCTYRGEVEAKNKGKMAMYFIENNTPVNH